MIITKTPYRISFFGGGSDYPEWYMRHGGAILSTTIDKYIYLSCRKLPPFFKHKHRIVWSKVELVNEIKEIKHKAVKEMLILFKIKDGIELHYDGDLPARSGMGSSSCFVVGMMNTLSLLRNKNLSKKRLAEKSIYFEQKILKETVGSQDQIAASYGGFNRINFSSNGNFNVKPIKISQGSISKLNKNLILLYTGVQRTAHRIADTYVGKLKKEKHREIIQILEFVKEAEKVLKNRNFDDFGRLLHESWLTKKKLSNKMTNNSLDEIYNLAIKRGALGGKILGAGGGGFFLLYVPHERQNNFLKHFKKFVHIPFKFENSGSKMLFNQKNF